MLALWRVGTHNSRVPYSGKLKLEGAERGSKPSKRGCETHPEQIEGEEVAKVGGRGVHQRGVELVGWKRRNSIK